MRAALIDGENVVNVIEYDPKADWTPPKGHEVTPLPDDSPVGPGWIVDVATQEFVAPALPEEGLSDEPADDASGDTVASLRAEVNRLTRVVEQLMANASREN